MMQVLTGYLRARGANGFRAAAPRLGAVLGLMLILPLTVCAYTVVMRSGRRIVIPASFTVTRTTLTYEAAPGINVTLQISSIDIAATELANNEPSGSLLKRAMQQPAPQKPTASIPSPAQRTMTNQDLEKARRARLESEAAYERRRAELKLPSLEETRRRNEEEAATARKQLQESIQEEERAEAYWRERASALRTEMEVLDAQINYLRARIAEIHDPSFSGFYGIATTIVPAIPSVHGALPRPGVGVRPHVFGTQRMGARVIGGINIGGGTTRGTLRLNPPIRPGIFERRPIIRPRAFVTPLTVFAAPLPFDYSYDRATLVTRLYELEAARAGLQVRWELLEDEARRAGALPGWLRP